MGQASGTVSTITPYPQRAQRSSRRFIRQPDVAAVKTAPFSSLLPPMGDLLSLGQYHRPGKSADGPRLRERPPRALKVSARNAGPARLGQRRRGAGSRDAADDEDRLTENAACKEAGGGGEGQNDRRVGDHGGDANSSLGPCAPRPGPAEPRCFGPASGFAFDLCDGNRGGVNGRWWSSAPRPWLVGKSWSTGSSRARSST